MNVVWLAQLGTPDAPTPKALRRYLGEFLMDPDVIRIPGFLRTLLVRGLIVPFRAAKSAEAYQAIWTEKGSPLRVYTEALEQKLATQLGSSYRVIHGMRYGKPSLEESWNRIKALQPERIVFVPLYPQFANATTGSMLREATRVMEKNPSGAEFSSINAFFHDEGYLRAVAKQAETFDLSHYDRIYFSFHGLPERDVKAEDETRSHCLLKPDCCAKLSEINCNCYRAQCFETARRVSSLLNLPEEKVKVSFQSRLGPIKWISPYTDLEIQNEAKAGAKRVAVFCPSFVADCLETLEEIGMRAKEEFEELGGETLDLIPCPNADPVWVEALAAMIARHLEREISAETSHCGHSH